MSHTPGPWYCHMYLSVACQNDGEYGDATCITNTPEDEYVATGNSGDWVAFVPHDRNHDANARLIAAAPEMLATLRGIADECERRLRKGKDQGDLDTLRLCRKAIAKVEGSE